MKANKKFISLETAKLLKDCGVESENTFREDSRAIQIIKTIDKDNPKYLPVYGFYPAYTWQEILWEYPEEFFGSHKTQYDFDEWNHTYKKAYEIETKNILDLLQQKEYEQADEYFVKNCVLIKLK